MKEINTKNYFLLPSVQSVLESLSNIPIRHNILVSIIREEIEANRIKLKNNTKDFANKQKALEIINTKVQKKINNLLSSSIKKVINATGIVLHTGLGRAPYGNDILPYLSKILPGYVNLEFDLESGKRGERLDHNDLLLRYLTMAESSAVVNNNAGAVLISINSLAEDKEIIISRGELVEIGGSFRLPEIIKKSGAKMIEIGTTNRTHLKDYQTAISQNTAAILVAHPSNYRVKGFTASPSHREIIELAHKQNIPAIIDLGSGALFSTEESGLPYEEQVRETVQKGFDIITFSGDKLLGSAQAGLIVGKQQYIEKIRKNPLMRILRCDKTSLSILNWFLRKYITIESAPEIAIYSLLNSPVAALEERCEKILAQISPDISDYFCISIEKTVTEAGSGSMPLENLPSIALCFSPKKISETLLAEQFRQNDPSIVGYLKNNKFYLDIKAIFPCEDESISAAITKIGSILINRK